MRQPVKLNLKKPRSDYVRLIEDYWLTETPKPQTKRTRILHKKPLSAVQKLGEASQIVESAKLRNTAVFQCLQEEHETKLRQMAETHEFKQKPLAEAYERARQEHLLRFKLSQQQLNE